ncbi:Conserved hypothetical protein [Seminavis robusta]|uniref:Uncharacterized protein n=1 Tax=Seminavis robusta TaxID=568900 RepID=A0A9N8EMY6_9STRA|nr:Conserved hypothetical protein [Seminavis robusta]|eukprot:Sro1583_g283910.1 Conserved hypothetical protein (580) ;mRNA; f:4225-6104
MSSKPQLFATIDIPGGFPMAIWDHVNKYQGNYYYNPAGDVETRTCTELDILHILAAIQNKPDWWTKVSNEDTTNRWRDEVMESLEEIQEMQERQPDDLEDYNQQLFDFALAETQWKAKRILQNGQEQQASVPAAVEGVFCRQAVSDGLLQKLGRHIATLRSRPAIGSDLEDRHPGTPQMVDLIHPSLYCYEQGTTMVLEGVGSEAVCQPGNWDKFLGAGTIKEEKRLTLHVHSDAISNAGLQWLPAEFHVNKEGKECNISSYINSLHPVEDARMYSSISGLFLEAWKMLSHNHWRTSPIQNLSVCRSLIAGPEPPTEKNNPVSLRDRPLQVIVKIASLELEPGESYAGGAWHVEGALDERIVATACCYLESSNVSGGDFGFRVAVGEPFYEQNDGKGVKFMYGLGDDQLMVQEIGTCSTPAGRILAWPNTLQHCVGPVDLVDPDQSGKRTICCLFLVDPTLRIRSTATVPPQQIPWYSDKVKPILGDSGLVEQGIQKEIVSYMPMPGMLTYEEACERRGRLMEERSALWTEGNFWAYLSTFSLSPVIFSMRPSFVCTGRKLYKLSRRREPKHRGCRSNL